MKALQLKSAEERENVLNFSYFFSYEKYNYNKFTVTL